MKVRVVLRFGAAPRPVGNVTDDVATFEASDPVEALRHADAFLASKAAEERRHRGDA